MKHEKFDITDPTLIDAVARSCGEVTVGCADVGGLVEEVMANADEMRERREVLQDVIGKLADDQKRVTDSTMRHECYRSGRRMICTTAPKSSGCRCRNSVI